MTSGSFPDEADTELAKHLSGIAADLAVQAGQLMQQRRAAGLQVATKTSSTDIVTDADKAVEAFIVERLRAERPLDSVVGEEGGSGHTPAGAVSDAAHVRWVIDPIDGTVNYLLGLPQYAVSIAAVQGERTVAGCVHNPVSGHVFVGARGAGAFCDSTPLRGPRPVPLAQAIVATGFGYGRDRRRQQGLVIAELLPRIANLRRAGSAALDLCFVAAGWVDAYFEARTNEWDHAAGLLIAEEAGAATSGLRGRRAGEWMVATCHPDLADEFFNTLTELGADVD